MTENPRSEEENITKDISYLLRLKKKTNDAIIIDIRNLFRLKTENKEIKEIVLRNIKNPFEY